MVCMDSGGTIVNSSEKHQSEIEDSLFIEKQLCLTFSKQIAQAFTLINKLSHCFNLEKCGSL